MTRQFNEISTYLETWYRSERGAYLRRQLQAEIDRRLETAFGYHILQVGPVQCGPLFGECRIRHRVLSAAQPGEGIGLICDSTELPLESDSVDVIIAHHSLEFTEHPHQVLRELQRVLTPQGQLLLTGWNPHSLHGIATRLRRMRRRSAWRGHRPVSSSRLTDWLNLLGFEVEDSSYLYSLPPLGSGRLRRMMERCDQWCAQHSLPIGGFYLLRAVKQVPAHNRPKPVRRRAEKLIGLAVAGSSPQPSPAPTVRPVGSAARNNGDTVLH